jgi:hypothetical protein
MKKILFALGVLSASFAQAQTVDVTTLSLHNQQVHRIAFCRIIATNGIRESKNRQNLDRKKVFDIYMLLDNNGFMKREQNSQTIFFDATSDTETKVLLEEIDVTQEMIDKCEADLKNILREKYVPNFSYMEK